MLQGKEVVEMHQKLQYVSRASIFRSQESDPRSKGWERNKNTGGVVTVVECVCGVCSSSCCCPFVLQQ